MGVVLYLSSPPFKRVSRFPLNRVSPDPLFPVFPSPELLLAPPLKIRHTLTYKSRAGTRPSIPGKNGPRNSAFSLPPKLWSVHSSSAPYISPLTLATFSFFFFFPSLILKASFPTHGPGGRRGGLLDSQRDEWRYRVPSPTSHTSTWPSSLPPFPGL